MELVIVLLVTALIGALISWAWIEHNDLSGLDYIDREYEYEEEYLGDDKW